MATGALDANGIWQYGEDDSEPTFSGLLNKLGESTSDQIEILKSTGRVVNTVSFSSNTATATTSDAFQPTNLTVSITPKSAANKILIIAHSTINSTGTNGSLVTLYRNTTNLSDNNGLGYASQAASRVMTITYLDSPATTSATSYTFRIRSGTGGTTTTAEFSSVRGTITVMEIAG
jgi:hypothetical protein